MPTSAPSCGVDLTGKSREWHEVLEGFDVEDSQVVMELTAAAREQARMKAHRADLLEVAQTRFAAEVTEEDRQLLSAQENVSVLREWFTAALTARDYAAFRAALRRLT